MAQYKAAGEVLDKLALGKGGSVKNLIYKSSFRDKRVLYGLVGRTLEQLEVVREIQRRSPSFEESFGNLGVGHRQVLIYDVVLGK
eukprot:CAMPEP_0119142002 /NCGR_PEP_ID=MMETSP1310-20130426/31953_1 /TAXON_ID=464262 /ORGANISM="Genus nov. species nov., Strain RCC2339" /LENGTH=84 /DNA_ID=CAMNT_0007133507 /DNA_START=14 /DNA_END=265 /DNA_ORIENTATION=+